MTLITVCPRCNYQINGVFQYACPNCSFNISALAGRGTTSFQVLKWLKHTDLLQGQSIQLAEGEKYNASFNFNGYAKLDDIVRFTITYGDRVNYSSPRSRHPTSFVISYIPEQLGAGTAIHYPGTVPCSGICLVSPQSDEYAHSYPVIDEWVHDTFARFTSYCRFCNMPTAFGQPICENCYSSRSSDWLKFL